MRMYDSVEPGAIPSDAPAVAGYVDGRYAWDTDDWALFGDAFRLRIAVFASTDDGDVLDVETGDATPQEAPGWVAMRRAAGLARPVLYCNRSTWAEVRREMALQGQDADYWIADYTGTPHSLGGAIACQWTGDAGSGGHYDLSEIDDAWVNPQPAPQPQPPSQGDTMHREIHTVPTLDDQGNGYIRLPGLAGKVVSVTMNGDDPATQGYPAVPRFAMSDRGADVLLVVTGGKPHAGFDVQVWVTG